MNKWVFVLLQLVLCGQVWGDVEYPLTSELHGGGVGQVVTMVSNEYMLTEGYSDRKTFKVNRGAKIVSLGRRHNREFLFYVDERKQAIGFGWLHASRIASRQAMQPLESIYPGLKNYVQKIKEQNNTNSQKEAPAPGIGKLQVNVMPANARVRIMNIAPKYTPMMELTLGNSYDVEVDAPGYETVRKSVTLRDYVTELRIDLKATSAVKNTAVSQSNALPVESQSTSTSSSIIRKNTQKVLLTPVPQDAMPEGQLRSPGVKLPYDYYKNGYGTVTKTLVERKLDKVMAANVTNLKTTHDTLPAGSHFIVLYSVNLYSNYVMYKGSSGKTRFAWLNRINIKTADRSNGVEVFGHIHPTYFQSALKGYFSKVKPLIFYSKGFEYKLPTSPVRRVWLEEGKAMSVYMVKPGWKNVLVKITYGDRNFYRWVEVENFYKTRADAQVIVQENTSAVKGQLALFGVTLFFIAVYYLYALGTRSGRNMLATMSYVALDDARKWLTVIVSVLSLWFFYSGTYMLLSIDLQDLTLQTTETEALYILWCLPGLILLPMFLYIGFVFVQMASSGTPSEKFYQNSDLTLDRGQASRENRGINDNFGTLETDMDGIRAKAETERMNRMQAAMRARTKAYDEFIASAKSQRAAEVEASYGDK